MMKLNELCDWLWGVFGDCKCEDESNNGLQVEGSADVKRIAFAVDACMETIEKAAAQGADMLFVHHGLSWGSGFKRFTGMDAARFRALFTSNLSLFAMHLPLDAHKEIGNNAVLAKRLGLTVTSTFCKYHGMDIGMVCKLDAPLPLDKLLDRARSNISADSKLTDNTQGVAHGVAFVSGGGDFAIDMCREAGADCLVTGEFMHQRWHNAQEQGVSIIATGHYDSENTGVKALMAKVQAELPLETLFIEAPTGL